MRRRELTTASRFESSRDRARLRLHPQFRGEPRRAGTKTPAGVSPRISPHRANLPLHPHGYVKAVAVWEVLLLGFAIIGVFLTLSTLRNSANSSDIVYSGEPVFNLSVISNGRKLWLQRGHSEVAIVDLETFETTRVLGANGPTLGNSCVSRDGETWAFSIENQEVSIYHHDELVVSDRDLSKEPEAGFPPRIALSSNGRAATRVLRGTVVRHWDLGSDLPVESNYVLTERAHRIALDSTGDRLLVVSGEGVLSVHESKTGRRLQTFSGSGPLTADAVFSDEGNEVAVVRGDCVTLYNVSSGKPEWTVDTNKVAQFYSVAISPNGEWVAANGLDAGIYVIKALSGQIHQRLIESSHMRRLSFSPHSDELYCGCKDGTVRVWSLPEGREINQIKPFEKTKPLGAT